VADTLRSVVTRDVSGSERGPAVEPGGISPDPSRDEVWRLLVSVHGRLLAHLDREMRRSHGCSQADYEVLVALSEHEGALRMTDLAEQVMLSPSGLTRRVDRLVQRGLVCRRACPSDGRGAFAGLTEAGWEGLRRAAPTHTSGVRRYLLGPVSAEGIEQLTSGLRSVHRALEDATVRAAPAGPGAQPGRSVPAAGDRQPGSGPATTG
jgi:DNA-binding MarR family transcriptional regulator